MIAKPGGMQVSNEQEQVIRKIIEVMIPLPPGATKTLFTRDKEGNIEEIVLEFASGETLFCIAFKEDRTATLWVWGAKTAVQEGGLRRVLMPAYRLILDVVQTDKSVLYSEVAGRQTPVTVKTT